MLIGFFQTDKPLFGGSMGNHSVYIDPFHTPPFRLSELAHKYGDRVHIMADPFLSTQLGRLCSPDTHQPAINSLTRELYRELVRAVISNEFPRTNLVYQTRMIEHTQQGMVAFEGIERNTPTVTVDIARAGMLPSQTCYDVLNNLLNPELVRQDHLIVSRTTDAEDRVTGAKVSGTKIGGPVEKRIVLLPDPMGATGISLSTAIDLYKKDHGVAMKYITLNLIITPEFIRNIHEKHPEVNIYALRLDRGLSPPEVLQKMPGEDWEHERGLNDIQYIVPGAGGMGEVLNNAFV